MSSGGSVPWWREASVHELKEKVEACLPYPGATSMPEKPYRPRESQDAQNALNELARRARVELDAMRMFAAVVWSMPDKRATLWPPQIREAPDLVLSRYDSPTDKSIVFTAEKS